MDNIGLSLLDGVIHCDDDALQYVMQYPLITKDVRVNTTCPQSKHVAVKTIRLRLQFGLDWLKRRPDIKVIHLIRDPRAQIASLSETIWPNRDAVKQCGLMLTDLQLSNELKQER
jgi:hypothetical protein